MKDLCRGWEIAGQRRTDHGVKSLVATSSRLILVSKLPLCGQTTTWSKNGAELRCATWDGKATTEPGRRSRKESGLLAATSFSRLRLL